VDNPFSRPRRPRPTPGFDRAAYDRAARSQELDRHLSGRPVPARITLALDLRELDGDQVDRDLGVWEPPDGWTGPGWDPGTAVDRWEAGTLVPTREQVMALSRLTDLPWHFFYAPVGHLPDRMFICERRPGGHGLTIMRNTVDDNGVLHSYEESSDEADAADEVPDPPKPSRRPPAQGKKTRDRPQVTMPAQPIETHRFDRDYYDPLVCRRCGLPKGNRTHNGGGQ
jgi:hypothetical protein